MLAQETVLRVRYMGAVEAVPASEGGASSFFCFCTQHHVTKIEFGGGIEGRSGI